MKFALLTTFCLTIGITLSAQTVTIPRSRLASTIRDSIAWSRNHTTRAAMLTLGSWATLNIASGFIVSNRQVGPTRYAWQMNAYWNIVNLGLAGMGYLHAVKEVKKSFSALENYDAQLTLEKIYYFNLGLDLGYIATGLFLHERGMNTTNAKTSAQLQGYGTSILIQGGFLLIMDGTMILLHHRNTARARARLQAAYRP